MHALITLCKSLRSHFLSPTRSADVQGVMPNTWLIAICASTTFTAPSPLRSQRDTVTGRGPALSTNPTRPLLLPDGKYARNKSSNDYTLPKVIAPLGPSEPYGLPDPVAAVNRLGVGRTLAPLDSGRVAAFGVV